MIDVYNQIKNNLESMTPETATIGRLVDTKTLFLEYRKKLQDVYTDVKMSKSPFQIDLNYYSHNTLMKNIKKRWKEQTKFGLTVNQDLQLVGENLMLLNQLLKQLENPQKNNYVTM